MKRAYVAVDLVNDFVTGKFGSQRAVDVANRAARFLSSLPAGSEVIFTLDTPLSGT